MPAGRVCRANIEIPKSGNATNRTDIEVLFDSLPEPIDLELDLEPSRPLLDGSRRSSARQHRQSRIGRCEPKQGTPEICADPLMEGIGIALDVPGNRMFLTDFRRLNLLRQKLDAPKKNGCCSTPRAIYRHRVR